MLQNKVYTAIGLMSGTSLDGEIDVALIRTDGHDYVEAVDFAPFPYDISVRQAVRACFGARERTAQVNAAESMVTDLHIRAVKESGFKADIIGFHGQTITHDPYNRFTWQLGDGQRLAKETGIDVVFDMRQADVKAGGQGAPLIPLYHMAMAAGRGKPMAVLNIGGVANVTYIGADGGVMAFDTGPGNALLDDFLLRETGKAFDENGALAMRGTPDAKALSAMLSHPYFKLKPPKSLDRNMFLPFLQQLPRNTHDAAATLTAFTVQGVYQALKHFPQAPEEWLVCGGGRKNAAMMGGLALVLNVPVYPVEAAGHNGDAVEAEGFAYLAVRSLLNLPLTLPSTTGVREPMTGGVLAKAV